MSATIEQPDPEALEALEAAARDREAAGRHAEAAQAWEQLAAGLQGDARAPALVRQARIVGGPLGQPEEASRLYRRALVNDPANREALNALTEYATSNEDWHLLANLQRARFTMIEDRDRRVDVALAAAGIEHERLHSPGGARGWLERGLNVAPDAIALHEALADLDRERGDDEALLRRLERVIELYRETPPPSALLEAAELRSNAGDLDRALLHLERASTLSPEDTLVLDALADLLSRLDRAQDQADVLQRRAALAADDPDTCAAVLVELGELLEQRLFDAEAALDAFERAHAVAADAPGVPSGLVRLRAKVEAEKAAAERAEQPAAPGEAPDRAAHQDPDAALDDYEREARVTTDRTRLGILVGDIIRIHERRGTAEQALPWVQRWVASAPEEPAALQALARLYEHPGAEAELCATLEALDPMLSPADQASNRRRVADLQAQRGHADEAILAFERALAIEPSDVDALQGLAAVLRREGHLTDLVAAQWRLAEHLERPHRADCLSELASLQEQIEDLPGAIETLARLERDDDAPSDAADRLDALLLETDRIEELETRLTARHAEHEPDSAEAVSLQLRRAQLLLDRLNRVDDAAAAFRDVLEHAPESPEARSGLERALRSSIDAAGLAEFLREQAIHATDPATRDRCALERAVLLEEALERPDEAREIYREISASAEAPELRTDASDRYERLLELAGEWDALRAHLEGAVGRGTPSEDERLHERLARLCADRLRDDAGELLHLERVVAANPARADIWHTLGERYEHEGRTDDLVRAMEAELSAGVEHPRELTLAAHLASVCHETLNDPARALHHYARVFELDPSHTGAARFLIEHYEEAGQPEALIRILEARLAGVGPSPEGAEATARTALRLQIARVRESQLDDLEGAISALEVALGEAGPSSVVAEPLAEYYQRAGYALDLVDLCQRAAAECDEASERANWFVRLGDTYLGREQHAEAAHAFRQALTERPDDRAVQASLRELYRQSGDAESLARLLEAEIAHLAGSAEIPVRLELAELLSGPLARAEDARIHARRVLQLEPDHSAAFERAVGLDEQLERHDEALGLIDDAIGRARSAARRAYLLIRRARLLAGPLSRPGLAADAYAEALRLDPSRRPIRGELSALLERHGCWPELLECLEAEAREAYGAERVALLEKAASIASDRLSADAALPWLERLRIERPGDPAIMARIAAVHRGSDRTEALLRTLGDEIRTTRNPERRRDLHLERAEILERDFAARGRALSALREARAAVPEDAGVLQRVAQLQERLGHHNDRAETLESLLAITTGRARIELHRELADLYAGPVSDADRAAAHWHAALDQVAPNSTARIEILRALAESERRAGRLDRWALHAEEELASLDPAPVFDERRRELRRELALTYDARLARPDAALHHLRALLDAEEDELLGGEVLDTLERTCLRLLRLEHDPVELATRLARSLEQHPDDAEGWLELARLYEEKLQSTRAALDAYRRTLDLDPTCLPALRGLRATADRLGRWSDVADALELELAHPDLEDSAERSALLRRLGDISWHRLQSTTRASRSYAAALEVNSADFASLRALERLLEAMEDWRGALDLYESEIEVLGAEDPERRREVWLHVASLARNHTEDVERARRAFGHAQELGSLETAHLASYAELHRRAGDERAFAEVQAAWCDVEDSPAAAADHVALAECLEALGSDEEALDRIDRALELDADHADAWDLAARLRLADGNRTGSAEALAKAAALREDAAAADRLRYAAALIAHTAPEHALDLLRTAAGRDPACGEVHAERAQLASALDLADEAEESAGRALDLGVEALDPAEIAAVARVGGEAARSGGRLEAAAGFFRRALDATPDSAEAAGALGETLAELGDFPAARAVLRRHLDGEAAGDDPNQARHLAILGTCQEAEGDLEEALASFEAALVLAPRLEEALAASVRVHEALEHVDEGLEALERWARAAATPADRAQRLLRAAEWELRVESRETSAEQHLRDAVRADATLAPAWIALVRLLSDTGRLDEAIETADRSGAHISDDIDFATLALLQAHAYEQRGDRHEAADSFGVAAATNPRCNEAALARARLLRGFGEWRSAAETLAYFIEQHDDPEAAELAEMHEQLGRLRAGPLEDVDGAVQSYRRAAALDPDHLPTRAALAELLSHRPGDWDEALSHHRLLFEANPTDATSLRVALRIARGRGDANGVSTGIRILRALGVASAYEIDDAPDGPLALAESEPALDDPRFEKLRLVAQEASRQIAEALDTPGQPGSAPSDDPEATFRAAVLDAEGQLTAAALLPLPTRELAEFITLIATLVIDPEQVHGDGRRVNALSTAIRRRLRKRLARILEGESLESLRAVDFDRWRSEVRSLAAAVALRETGCDLRTALVALVRESTEIPDAGLREDADLTSLVAAEPVARGLLRRIVRDWLARI